MNTALICLGANTPDASARLCRAVEFLATLGEVLKSSGKYPTAPEYAGETEPYLNEIVVIDTALPYRNMLNAVKSYETGMRELNEYSGLVNLDIDIVYWNGSVVRPKDACAAYFLAGLKKVGLELDAQSLGAERSDGDSAL